MEEPKLDRFIGGMHWRHRQWYGSPVIGTRLQAVATLVTVATLLAGCSLKPTEETPSPESQEPLFDHVHEMEVDPGDGSLLLATHEGLRRLSISEGGTATASDPVDGLELDLMSFALVDGIAYASGHPGPSTPDAFGSPNLGLITSTDMGSSWENVSLIGDTDFHALSVLSMEAGAPRVFGYDESAQRLLRSFDGGHTWAEGASLAARDILAVKDGLYAATAMGIAVSADDGATFVLDPEAPNLYVIAADRDGTVVGIDASGALWTHTANQEWSRGGNVEGTAQALAVYDSQIYVADDRGIATSSDLGATWLVLTLSPAPRS